MSVQAQVEPKAQATAERTETKPKLNRIKPKRKPAGRGGQTRQAHESLSKFQEMVAQLVFSKIGYWSGCCGMSVRLLPGEYGRTTLLSEVRRTGIAVCDARGIC